MRRSLEPVDLIVVVGICATVLGGYLLFMATSGTLAAAPPEQVSVGRASDITDAMDWVQPALGQAVVDDVLLRRKASDETAAAVRELNRATLAAQQLQPSPLGQLEQVRAQAARVEADHEARVQFVMGRTIVNFTARGVRAGVLSPAQYSGEYNRRMIRVAEATGRNMDQAFRTTWQANLEQMIRTANQDRAELTDRIQEQIGAAIARVGRTQDGYREAMEAMQEQVAAVAIAAIGTELRADLFARLAAADLTAQQMPIPVAEPRSWPEVPTGFLFAASAALIGIFCAGILIPSVRAEAVSRPEEAEMVYRKSA